MNKEECHYIIKHYAHLLSGGLKPCVNESFDAGRFNSATSPENVSQLSKIYKAKGWIEEHEDAADILKNGSEAFEKQLAVKIKSTFPEEVFLNYCPSCGKLARTPSAKQCRCGNRWS